MVRLELYVVHDRADLLSPVAEAQGEGEQMVMDLQDVTRSLADGISKSQIQLLGTSSAPLQVERDDSDADEDDLDPEILELLEDRDDAGSRRRTEEDR